jgi:hypothetical protein
MEMELAETGGQETEDQETDQEGSVPGMWQVENQI